MFSKIKNTETQPWWQDRTPKLFDLPCDQVQEHLDNLLSRVKTRLPELEKLLSQIHSYNAPEELGMYGIYHSSLKSLAKLQEITEKGSALIKEIGGEDYPPHPRYCQIVKEGTLPEFPFSHKRDRLQESLDPARLILSVLLTPSGSSHRFLVNWVRGTRQRNGWRSTTTATEPGRSQAVGR
jgi:hypothetical protein